MKRDAGINSAWLGLQQAGLQQCRPFRLFLSRSCRPFRRVYLGMPAVLLVLAGALVPDVALADELHLVQPGETLSAIAEQYNVTVAELAETNRLAHTDLIYAGVWLRIRQSRPRPTAAASSGMPYRVVAGDTLSAIATRFGVSERAIEEANNIADPDYIQAGQVLLIPPRGTGTWELSRAQARAALQRAAAEFGVDPALLQALAWQESGWQQNIVSPEGAVGLMQLLPETATWAVELLLPGPADWRGSALDNARVGAAVLRHLLRLTNGDVFLALAAYYQGWRSVQTHGPYAETRQYVRNVLALADRFR